MSTLKVDAIRHNSATSDAITTHSDGTASAKIADVGGSQLSNRNLQVNGAMVIAQKATTDTGSEGLATVDKFGLSTGGEDEDLTQEQGDVASGTTPYSLGFRKHIKLQTETKQVVLVLMIELLFIPHTNHKILLILVGITLRVLVL